MRNVRLLFAIAFFSEAVAACVAYLFPLTREFGGSVNSVLWLQVEFIVLLACLQLPTGRFADQVSYKISIVLGMFIVFGSSCLYLFAGNLLTLFIAEAVWALGAGFVQGADVSLLRASLLQEANEGDSFQKYRGYLGALRTCSRIGYFFIGGFLVEYWLYAPFLLTVVFLAIACGLSLQLRDIKMSPMQARAAPRKTREICIQYLNPQSFTGRVLIAQALILSGTYIGFWLSTPWMELLEVRPSEIGVSLALLAGLSAASNGLASRWKLQGRSLTPYLILILLTVSGFYLLTLGSLSLGLLGLALQKAAFGFTDVIVDKQLLDAANVDEKATIASLSGMLRNGCGALFLLVCIASEQFLEIPDRFGLIGVLIVGLSTVSILVCSLRRLDYRKV